MVWMKIKLLIVILMLFYGGHVVARDWDDVQKSNREYHESEREADRMACWLNFERDIYTAYRNNDEDAVKAVHELCSIWFERI